MVSPFFSNVNGPGLARRIAPMFSSSDLK